MTLDRNSIILSILVCIFAMGSWIDLNGVWVELPLLVHELPEGWYLPTYIVSIVQIANIAPILYMTFNRCTQINNTERITIYLILGLGCICCALLSIFWNYTTTLTSGKEASIAFFVLISFLSIVDTTSSVTFLPYMVNYHHSFVTALYVGEGLSGFVPGVAGLIQGSGAESYCVNYTSIINGTNATVTKMYYPPPRFSVSIFFILLCCIMILCLVSFTLVDRLPSLRQFRTVAPVNRSRFPETEMAGDQNVSEYGNSSYISSYRLTTSINHLLSDDKISKETNRQLSQLGATVHILLVAYINFLTNGLLPSIQNYTLLPYSNSLYHLVVTLTQLLNPIACLLTLRKWKNVGIKTLTVMTILASIASAYLIFLAIQSPKPFLLHSGGPALAVISWLSMGVIFSFEKTLLAIRLQSKGHGWLQLCGAFTQIGSALGALFAFLVVTVFKLLSEIPNTC